MASAREAEGTEKPFVQHVRGPAEPETLKAKVKALETINQEPRRHRANTEKVLIRAKALLSHRQGTAT